ncbi:HSP20-like chaperone [Haematococcus lacustris]
MALQLFNDPLFGDIERTVSRAFQPYFGAMMPGKGFDAAFTSGGLYPMDIHEHKDRYSLVAGKYWAAHQQHGPACTAGTQQPSTHKRGNSNAPGFSPEQVHVELQGDTLVVSGEKKSSRQDKHEEGGVKTHRRERTFTRFTRAFVLPEDAKPDNISARIDNGVLTVDIPKEPRAPPQPRRITVQAAGADAASQPAASTQQKAAGSNGSA